MGTFHLLQVFFELLAIIEGDFKILLLQRRIHRSVLLVLNPLLVASHLGGNEVPDRVIDCVLKEHYSALCRQAELIEAAADPVDDTLHGSPVYPHPSLRFQATIRDKPILLRLSATPICHWHRVCLERNRLRIHLVHPR